MGNVKSCSDGYPTCRKAEAEGSWCNGDCLEKLNKELKDLLEKRDEVRARQMKSYKDGSATRARTTTGNAQADHLNEKIIHVREQIKKAKS